MVSLRVNYYRLVERRERDSIFAVEDLLVDGSVVQVYFRSHKQYIQRKQLLSLGLILLLYSSSKTRNSISANEHV